MPTGTLKQQDKSRVCRNTVTFAAGGIGEFDTPTITIFNVTGEVMVEEIIVFCSESLAGATGTLECGIAGNTAALIAQSTATDIDVDEFWVDTAPATVEGPVTNKAISSDIILTVGTADITDGTLEFYVRWHRISENGVVSTSTVTAA